MVAHYQVALGYSIISKNIIHSFETDSFWLLTLLNWFLLNSLIYENDYLACHNKMGQKVNLGDM